VSARAVALIPVLEIGYNNQGVEVPTKYPYWENTTLWDAYHAGCYTVAGFRDELHPYRPGASFYCLPAITDANLAKLARDQTAEVRAGIWARVEACGFFGGYVLRMGEEDIFFPQCCGQLSDIVYWERLAAGTSSSYEGHPAPLVRFTEDTVLLDFIGGKFDEDFQPPIPVPVVEISRPALQFAVAQANRELAHFAQRLREVNEVQGLGVPAIDKLLIWNDGKHD
jgi:hypothetical protein